MAKEFYYQVMGTVVGPVTGVQLREKAAEGTVTPDALVCVGGNDNWVAASHLKGLFDKSGHPIPPLANQPKATPTPNTPASPPPPPLPAKQTEPEELPGEETAAEQSTARRAKWPFVVAGLGSVLLIAGAVFLYIASTNNWFQPDPLGECEAFVTNLDTELEAFCLDDDTYILAETVSYNVEKTNSLVSPYIATIDCTIPGGGHGDVTSYFKDLLRADYAYQKGQWTCKRYVASRKDFWQSVRETIGGTVYLELNGHEIANGKSEVAKLFMFRSDE